MTRRRAVIIAAAVFMLAAGGVMIYRKTETRSFEKSSEIFANALMGYAPVTVDSVPYETTLRYLMLTWKEVEPEEGVYDWETIDEKYGLSALKEKGVHLVFRFVCDYPGSEPHLDIPLWLYEKTGDGSWYSCSAGAGYSPDYSNEIFIEAHERVIKALGEYLGDDGFASYVELGSLGHWGEWHVRTDAGVKALPNEKTRDRYVKQTAEAFPKARLMMRRPFNIVSRLGLGLFNDMTGYASSTLEWLYWIENGGSYNEEEKAMTAVPKVWESAPVGGEFTSALTMEEMLVTNLDETLGLIKDSHMTFIGPLTADYSYEEGFEEVLGSLGYRLSVTKAELSTGIFGIRFSVTLENDGETPFYFDWDVNVYVESSSGELIEKKKLKLKLSELMPEGSATASASLSSAALKERDKDGCRISIGIIDPMTGKDAVRFSIKGQTDTYRPILFKLDGSVL